MPSAASKILLSAEAAGDEGSLLDVLDHVLNKGVIIHGNLIISLAGVDLIYLGLDAILTSVETALQHVPFQALPTARKQ
ncbi:MAG TPA: gas vesicle protein [Terriglobales bacterium]|nr:gas vesicle protein [Terriglobales bacterium]